MEELKKVIVKERLGIGDIVIKNVLDTRCKYNNYHKFIKGVKEYG